MSPEDIDINALTVDQKLDLIEKLWDSIPPGAIPIPDGICGNWIVAWRIMKRIQRRCSL